MTNNEKMLVKHGKNGKGDWKGKVRIIGISLDSKVKECLKHIIYKGWISIEHYLCIKMAGQELDNPVAMYEVSGIPHVILVDKKGNIVFKGHPAGRNLEDDINKLIRGEELK